MTLGLFDFRNARPASMSDDQYERERKAQKRLRAAIAEMRAAVDYVNENSAVVEIEPSSFDNLVHDEFPSDEYWAEKLLAARR